MRVFVINLDRSPERMQRTASLLGDIPFQRIAAVDSHDLRPQVLAPNVLTSYPMTNEDLACIMSHRRAWEIFAEADDDQCVVLEDDLHFGRNFRNLATNGIAFGREYDVIKLETFKMKVWIDRYDSQGIGSNARIARLHSRHYGAGAYVVSRSGARRLLSVTERPTLPIDLILFGWNLPGAPSLRRYQMIPACAIQDMCLRGEPGFEGVASIVEPARQRAYRTSKLTGLRKLQRETIRPFFQLTGLISHLLARREHIRVGFE